MSHLTNTVYSYLNLSAFRSPARALPRSLSLFLSLARSFQCQFAMHAQHVKPWELRNARTVSNQPINKHYTLDWSYEERRWSGDSRKNKAFSTLPKLHNALSPLDSEYWINCWPQMNLSTFSLFWSQDMVLYCWHETWCNRKTLLWKQCACATCRQPARTARLVQYN